MIRISAPESLASSFLSFIEAKSRQNIPIVKKSQSSLNEEYFNKMTLHACTLFDDKILQGMTRKQAISDTLKYIKLIYANVTYDSLKGLLSKNGRFKTIKAVSSGS